MNTPNPLIPQGTFPDSRRRSHIRIAFFTIIAVHVLLLSALLIAGCKKTPDADASADGKGPTNVSPVFNPPPDTNPPIAVQPITPPTPVPLPQVVTPPTPDPTPAAAGSEYVILKGDSFSSVAKKYGVTARAISEANPGVDSTKLKIGQKLKIPAAGAATTAATPHDSAAGATSNGIEKTYTVKSGDNLMKIAKANGIGPKALRSANNLKTDQIKVGQKLKIPSKATATTAATPEPVPVPVSAVATGAPPQ